MRRALADGLLASLFFAFTFIFNRSMNLDGGYWLWSAADHGSDRVETERDQGGF